MNITPVAPESAKKPIPTARAAGCHPLRLLYNGSTSGVDSSLIVFLHGLGDTERPFAALAQRLQRAGLPAQTATLSVGGGAAVPFVSVEQQACAYWDVWDAHGQEISHANPTVFLRAFCQLLAYLTRSEHDGGCGWPASAIHLFGFAHGATAAMEGAIAWTRGGKVADKIVELTDEEEDNNKGNGASYAAELGSIVSVCGDMLSHPTFTPPLAVPTLVFHRAINSSNIASIKRAFANTQLAHFPSQQSSGDDDDDVAMPRSDAEWRAIMMFWARHLRTRSAWELDNTDGQQLFTVSSGKAATPATTNASTGSTVLADDIGWSPTAEEIRSRAR